MVLLALVVAACGTDEDPGEPAADPDPDPDPATEEPEEAEDPDEDTAEVTDRPDSYVIGVNIVLSGPLAFLGRDTLHGIELAVEEINAAGGVDGVPLELDVRDNAFDASQTVLLARQMAPEVDVMISGVTGTQVLSVLPIVSQAETPHFIPGVSTVSLTESGDEFIVRTLMSGATTARVMSAWMVDQDTQRVSALYEASDFGEDNQEALENAVEARGIELAEAQSFNPGDTDFTAQAARIAAADPDVVVIWHYPGEQPVRQLRQAGYDGPVIGGLSQYYRDFADPLGDLANNSFFTSEYHPDASEGAAEFEAKFLEEFGNEPDGIAPIAYDTVYLIAESLEAVGNDPRAIVDYARNAQFEGAALGGFSFDPATGDFRPVRVFVSEWLDGERVLTAEYTAQDIRLD